MVVHLDFGFIVLFYELGWEHTDAEDGVEGGFYGFYVMFDGLSLEVDK